jgi:hypothetical protein
MTLRKTAVVEEGLDLDGSKVGRSERDPLKQAVVVLTVLWEGEEV